ncbi:MAG TPA: hypothetical protein VGK20_14185 [Candidatus Binatia bacterium]
MTRLIPASRAIAVATGLVLASAVWATAAETTTTETTTTEVKPFHPTIYAGSTIGWGEQESTGSGANAVGSRSNMGWGVQALARLIKYGGLQLEYWSVGEARHNPAQSDNSGHLDGLYLGVMPILPVGAGFSLFGQVGPVFSGHGDNVAGGGGVLYAVPIDFLIRNNMDLELRADYKYINVDGGDHLLTFGFMLGFHK